MTEKLPDAETGASSGWRAARVPLLVCFLLAALNVGSLLPLTVLPFTDLPNHLAEAAIHKHVRDPGLRLERFYIDEIGFAKPNVAHAAACSLFPSVEAGNKILYSLYLLGLPLLVMGLILAIGGDAWVGLLSILLLFNYNVVWGFAGFTLALPMLLVFLLCHIGALRRATWPRLGGMALSLLAVYWCHAQAFLLALLVLAGSPLAAAGGADRRRAFRCWIAALPAAILLAGWFIRGREFSDHSNAEFLRHYYSAGYLWDLPDRFASFFWMDSARLGRTSGRTLGLLFSLPTVAAFLLYLHPGSVRRLTEDAGRRLVLWFTVAAGLCYLVLPDALPGQLYLYERFCVLTYLGIICLLSLLVPAGHRRLLRSMFLLLAVSYSLLWRGYFNDFRRCTEGFNREFLKAPNAESAVMSAVIGEASFRGAPALIHYNNYQVIWNLGAAPTRAAQYRFGIVRKATPQLADYLEWIHEDTDIDRMLSNRYAGSDYVLTHGDRPRRALLARPDYEPVRQTNGWALFRARRDQNDAGRGASSGATPSP